MKWHVNETQQNIAKRSPMVVYIYIHIYIYISTILFRNSIYICIHNIIYIYIHMSFTICSLSLLRLFLYSNQAAEIRKFPTRLNDVEHDLEFPRYDDRRHNQGNRSGSHPKITKFILWSYTVNTSPTSCTYLYLCKLICIYILHIYIRYIYIYMIYIYMWYIWYIYIYIICNL